MTREDSRQAHPVPPSLLQADPTSGTIADTVRFLLVPHTVETQRARVWAAAWDSAAPPAGVSLLRLPDQTLTPAPDAAWRPVTAGGLLPAAETKMYVQTITLDNLSPDTSYVVKCDGATARFTTLPDRLPGPGETPLVVLLSSCFAAGNDPAGLVGAAVAGLPADSFPHLKILCGDQVYLDYPAFFLGLPLSESGLARNFFGKYRRNWVDQPGYRSLLETGATCCTADDHEFWNNYPNPTTLISNTWTQGGRDAMRAAALPLYQDFQCEDPAQAGRPRAFQIGPLSFFIADTRVFREPGDRAWMAAPDFAALLAWIRGLPGPGVLVVGQPVFAAPAGGFQARFADRALSNYEQYQDLVRALFDAPHSVLVLTGDVHYGRVAGCRIWSNPAQPQIFEVIASPASLVNRAVGGRAWGPPDKFPPAPIAGVAQVPMDRQPDYRTAEDHFVTLHITGRSGVVRVQPRYWFPKRANRAVPEVPPALELS